MHKSIAPFHFLTQDLPEYSHEDQVRAVCEAGVKWVQLRVKNKSEEEWLTIAEHARSITNEYSATLIINDNAFIAKAVHADGVHLGQHDMSWQQARVMLGDNFIIGCSVHSLHGILKEKNADINYFGLGPFRFTTTKENLNPILGLELMQQTISQARERGIEKPIIAIGGIQLQDVDAILNAGANGVAVSSAINFSMNKKQSCLEFLSAISNFQLSTSN